MTTGTDKPSDQSSNVVASGQISEAMPMRSVLKLVAASGDVEYGVLRILSKEVRGHIGIMSGRLITGAHITSAQEYGRSALRQLLGANKGMFAFLAMEKQQPELRQSLNVGITELLNWRRNDDQTLPDLTEVLDAAFVHGATTTGEFVMLSDEQASQSPLFKETEEQFASYLAWGDEPAPSESKLPTFNSILGKRTTQPIDQRTAAPGPIPFPGHSQPQQAPPGQMPQMPQQPPAGYPQQPPAGYPQQPPAGYPQQPPAGYPQQPPAGYPQQPPAGYPQQPPAGYPQQPPAGYPQQPPAGNPPPAQSQPQAPMQGPAQTPPQGQPQAPPVPQPPPPPQGQPGQPPDGYNPSQLDAIPTPKPTGSQPQPGAPAARNTQFAGAPRGTGQTPLPGAAPGQKPSGAQPTPGSPKSADGNGASAPEEPRVKTKAELEMLARTSQRMRAMETAEDYEEVNPIHEAKSISKQAMVGGLIGVVLLIVLAQQTFLALTYQSQFNQGLEAFKQEKFDIAIVSFTQALNAAPNDTKVLFYRALAEARTRQGNQALDDYNKVIALEPNNKIAWIARASLFNHFKKYESAISDCNKVIQMDVGFMDAYRVRATAYNALGQFQEAIADCKFYLDNSKTEDAQRAEVLANEAYAYYQKRDFEHAIKDYTEAIKCDPTCGTWWASRAVAYKAARDWKNALADANKAIELSPGDTTLFKIRGVCYAGLGEAEKAAADLNQLVKFNPTVENHRMRGNARLAIHDWKGALEDFEFVMGAKPHDEEARVKYQQARSGLQGTAKPLDAIAELGQPAKKEPVNLRLPEPQLVKRGYELMLQGEAEDAEQYLAEAVKKNPNDATARRYLAYTLIEGGSNEAAAAQFAALSKISPLPPGDMIMYAKALVDAKKVEDGITIYNGMLSQDPNNDRARQALIKALMSKGDNAKAKALADEGVIRSPGMASTYEELSKQASGTGKK